MIAANLALAEKHLKLALEAEQGLDRTLVEGAQVSQHSKLVNIGNDYLQLAEYWQEESDFWFSMAAADENQAHLLKELRRQEG